MNNWESDVTAVTGIIGSGKTTFVELLKKNGAFTVSADQLAREVVTPGSQGLEQVIAKFGKEFLSSSGELDRKKLGKLVFSDLKKKAELEAILHPLISKLGGEFFQSPPSQGRVKVYDCPLFFEAGLDKKGFKKIIVVSASPEVCINRIIERDKISRDEAKKKIESQWHMKQKIEAADIVIDNSSTLEHLEQEARRYYEYLRHLRT